MPDQITFRHVRSKVAHLRPHIPMRQLEPGTGKGIRELVRIGVKVTRDFFISRVHAHRHVSGGHHDRHFFRCIRRMRCHVLFRQIFGMPLLRTCRAAPKFPFIAEQHIEIAHVPCRWCGSPCPVQAARNCIATNTTAELAEPAKTLCFQCATFGLRTDKLRITRTMCHAEGMTTRHQRDCFRIIHRHAGKSFANVPR